MSNRSFSELRTSMRKLNAAEVPTEEAARLLRKRSSLEEELRSQAVTLGYALPFAPLSILIGMGKSITLAQDQRANCIVGYAVAGVVLGLIPLFYNMTRQLMVSSRIASLEREGENRIYATIQGHLPKS